MTTVKYLRFLECIKIQGAIPYTGLNSLCIMSETHEIGGVRHQMYQGIIFGGQLARINLDS
jgi:hypothetical protein